MTTKQLIEDYERRIKSCSQLLDNLKRDGTETDRFNWLTAKVGCYRTFISELKKLEEVVDNTSY